jgi:hypothetical protein
MLSILVYSGNAGNRRGKEELDLKFERSKPERDVRALFSLEFEALDNHRGATFILASRDPIFWMTKAKWMQTVQTEHRKPSPF